MRRRRQALVALASITGAGWLYALGLTAACETFGSTVPASDAGTDGDATAPSDAAFDGDPVSCRDLIARDPSVRGKSGRYTIDPDGPGGRPAFLVFCEMSLDDGGWTLVARSSLPADKFGWTTPTGSLSDVSLPYALDTLDAGLAFDEVMVADRKSFEHVPASHAYKLAVGQDFVARYRNAPLRPTVTTILGDCDVDGGPAALRYVGYTGLTDHFFFGDNSGTNVATGLGPVAFSTGGDDCASGASLNGAQGTVYVR